MTMGDIGAMAKDIERRTARLSVRIPASLKVALEREALRDRRTLADVVIIMLSDTLSQRSKKGARRG